VKALALEAFRLYWLAKEEKKEEGGVDFKTAKHSWEKVFDAYTDNYYGNDVETFADENNMTVEEVNKMSMDEIIDMARDTGVNYTDFAVLRQYFITSDDAEKNELCGTCGKIVYDEGNWQTCNERGDLRWVDGRMGEFDRDIHCDCDSSEEENVAEERIYQQAQMYTDAILNYSK